MKKNKTIKSDLQKLQNNRQFLAILILLFTAILFWIIISIVSSQTKEEISAELTLLAKPLTPNIEKETLLKIQEKYSYSEEELSSFTIYKILKSRDGKFERVVPLEVTIDDIDPIQSVRPTPQPGGLGSLLQEEDSEQDQQNIQGEDEDELENSEPQEDSFLQ